MAPSAPLPSVPWHRHTRVSASPVWEIATLLRRAAGRAQFDCTQIRPVHCYQLLTRSHYQNCKWRGHDQIHKRRCMWKPWLEMCFPGTQFAWQDWQVQFNSWFPGTPPPVILVSLNHPCSCPTCICHRYLQLCCPRAQAGLQSDHSSVIPARHCTVLHGLYVPSICHLMQF